MEERNGEGSAGYVYRVALVAAVGGLLFGYDTAVIAGATRFLKTKFSLDADTEGWATASILVGCIFGAAFAGTISDRLGRRNALLLSAVLFAVSAVGSAVPRNLTEFAVARLIGGLGVGAAALVSPLYIAEIAPRHIRGRLVSLNQLAIIGGMLVVSFVNALIASQGDEAWNRELGWRWMFGSEVLPALLFLALLCFVPRSPRWLIKQQRTDEAFAVLSRVAGRRHAESEVLEIREAIAKEETSIRQLFRPGMRLALLIGVALAILQQITGINTVMYYAPKIFEKAGWETLTALKQTVLVQGVNMASTVVAIWIVDRVGRKLLLLVASAGMGLSLVLLGSMFLFEEFQWVLVFVLAYVAFFGLAMGPVVWVVLSEIFPTRVRGRAMAIATVCLWTANFFVTQLFPRMLEDLGGPAFFVYAAMCVVAFFFVAGLVPETKGKSLEEIERGWLRKGVRE